MKKIFSIVGLFLVLFSCSIFGQLNYKFSAGSGTFTALTGATQFTWAAASADEGYTNATDIGFSFKYAGTDYTQFQVSTNGFLRFGTGLTDATKADALDGKLRQIVAPLWDNLTVGATSDITYRLEGTTPNQILTVEWNNVKWNSSASAANAQFQVKLYEGSNKIEFVYGAMTQPGSVSASIGLVDNTVISTASSATGKFLSLNPAGTAGSRVYYQSMGYTFNVIVTPPDANTVFAFDPVTPTPMTGTYTIGGTTPDFKSLSDAAMALNVNGVAGPVVLKVRDGSYDDVFHLIDVKGTSETNTITLMNESGTVVLAPTTGTGSSTSGSVASGDAIIRLEGTQHTTIQGLTLTNNEAATVAPKFEIGVALGNTALNGAMITGGRFNHFKDLTIDMKATKGYQHFGAIGFRYFTTGTTDTDTSLATSYNKIENCIVTGFWYAGFRSYGVTATNPDRGNVITGCGFGDVSGALSQDLRGIYPTNQADMIIEKNMIMNLELTASTSASVYGINFPATPSGTIIIRNNEISSLYNKGSQVTTGNATAITLTSPANNMVLEISGNKIYDLLSEGTWVTSTTNARVEALYLPMSTGFPTTTKIYNNMIYDLRCPYSAPGGGAPNVRGMALVNTGTKGTFIVHNNTIYLDNSVPPAVTKGTDVGHRSACLYLQSVTTAILDVKNNLFVNNMGTSAVGTGLSAAVCYQTTGPDWFGRMTEDSGNNLYFADTTVAPNKGIALGGSTIYKTMDSYRAISFIGPREANSFSADPTKSFVSAISPYDLHINPSSWLVKAQGTPSAFVKTDIDGDTRSTDVTTGPVSLGADEYTATGKPSVTTTGTIADSMTTVFTGVDGRTVGEVTWHKGKGTLPDSVALSYNPGSQLTTPAGSSIFKNYSVETFGGVKGWNADLKLFYNPTTELNGISETALKMHRKSNEVWSQLPTTVDTVKHFAQVNIISGADFTMGKEAPVQALTVAEAREDLNTDLVPDRIGQTFKLTGVVVTNNLSASDTGSVYFLNDKTAGIVLSSSKKFTKELSMGDSLQVTGVISQHNGQTEVVPADTVVGETGSMTVLKEKATVPAPVVITVKDLNSEKYEGNLVVVRGLNKKSSSNPWPIAKDTTMTVGVGSDSLSLFVDQDTKLPGSAEPEWPLDITGVVGQTSETLSDGYMLIPRNTEDVTVPVMTLAQAREDLDNNFIPDRKGQTLKAKGIVVSPDFTASHKTNNNYYVVDATAGVLLFSASKLTPALNIGDSILVKGKIDQFKGATEFVPLTSEVGEKGSVVVLKSNVKLPDPIEISVKDVNSEKYEGQLVKVKDLTKRASSPLWPASGANANMIVGTETDSTILFIDLDTDIDGTTEIRWPANVTGVVAQYTSSQSLNDGYELLPRSQADFDFVSGVMESSKIPASYALNQNYPNPFNPSTTISFDLKANANVTLKIYSVLGQEVMTLLSGSLMPAGHKTMSFNASNLPSGMYIYRLEAKGIDGSNFTGIKKMMLLK